MDEEFAGVVGTHFYATSYRTVWDSIADVIGSLGTDSASTLKISSGEHLAAVLATASLGVPPSETDVDGGPDLVFDLGEPQPVVEAITGRGDARFADFEVKSLPGPLRKLDAEITQALARGQKPRQTGLNGTFRGIADVVTFAGDMIANAAGQLEKKSSPERIRNVFLISHPLDHAYVEMGHTFIVGQLQPLTDLPDSVDAVWLLAFPDHLVVWSVADQRWTTLYFQHHEDDEELPGSEDGLDFLVAVDIEFRDQLGTEADSPYAFKLTPWAGGEQPAS